MEKDPRTIGKNNTVNEELQDLYIGHSVNIERLKNHYSRETLLVLNKTIIPDIEAKIESRLMKINQRGSDLGKTTTKRMEVIARGIKADADRMAATLVTSTRMEFKPIAKAEMEFNTKAVSKAVGVQVEFVLPAAATVATAAAGIPFNGLTLEQWYGTLSRSTQKALTQAVQQGVIEGETTEQIMRRIRGTKSNNFNDGVMQTTRRQAEAITRTSVQHITNQARTELFRANDDILKGLQYTATLDSRTSPICRALDGKVFPLDSGARPPQHINCRSAMVPVLKTGRGSGIKNLPESTRSSMDGAVPASTTYGKWLKSKGSTPEGRKLQNEVLGVRKAQMFRSGDVKIEQFVGKDLKPLTIKELEKKYDV